MTVDQLMQQVREAAREKAHTEFERKLSRVRCPVHDEIAKVRWRRSAEDGIEFDVAGCCDALVTRLRNAA
jgi:hypothetical protein